MSDKTPEQKIKDLETENERLQNEKSLAEATNDMDIEPNREGWPIIDHASTGNPECCGCWVWQFDRTGENYVTITCNECGEKRVLIKEMKENGRLWGTKDAAITEHPDVQRLIGQVVKLQAERERHRWIPVEERLPKNEYSILAYGEDGFGYKIVANTSYNLEFGKFRILSKVTHWKPIILPGQKG